MKLIAFTLILLAVYDIGGSVKVMYEFYFVIKPQIREAGWLKSIKIILTIPQLYEWLLQFTGDILVIVYVYKTCKVVIW